MTKEKTCDDETWEVIIGCKQCPFNGLNITWTAEDLATTEVLGKLGRAGLGMHEYCELCKDNICMKKECPIRYKKEE